MKKLFSLIAFLAIFTACMAQRNGYATYYFDNGTKFEGFWSNDVINGTGIYYWNSKHMFVGRWKNGKRNGYGIEFLDNGNYNVIYFENEVATTQKIKRPNTLNTGVGLYIGETKNGKACGNGTFTWKNGTYFKGIWSADGQSRSGVLYYSNGKPHMIGTWINEKLEGYACEFLSPTTYRTGFWQNSVFQYSTLF